MAATGFITHCGWLEIYVHVQYSAPCCDSAAPAGDWGLVHVDCLETNPLGQCDDISIDTEIGEGGTTGPGPKKRGRPIEPIKPIGNEFSFSVSAYGGILPIVFGSDKLNGNVIWASPVVDKTLIVEKEVVLYKTVSFALAVCEGVINGMLRMWVGERLIVDNRAKVDEEGVIQPDADGFVIGFTVDLTDPESPLRSLSETERTTTVSVFSGSETQIPEGVLVDEEGYDNTPAYRGVAYILFENFLVADSSVPTVAAEISANVSTLWPRQYADLVATTFNTVDRKALHYDILYDRVFYIGSHTGTAAQGIVIVDGNTMVESAQQPYVASNQWSNLHNTMSGFLVNTMADNNQGIVRVLNPFTGTQMSSIGPGGGISSHSLTTGFGVLGLGCTLCSGFDDKGFLTDVFVGIHASAASIGFASISKAGQIKMESVLNGVLPAAGSVCGAVVISDAHAEGAPLFYGGYASRGVHIFGIATASTELTSLKPWRVTISGLNATLAAPQYEAFDPISLDLFAGTGMSHSVRFMMVDADGCLVFFVIPAANSGRGTRIVKWSPWSGKLVWNTPVTPLPASAQSISGGEWAELTGDKYAWIDGNGQILQVDLKKGAVTTLLESLDDQQLPANLDARQYYNGHENSILYFSSISGQRVVKIFLDRLGRAQAPIATIVENLTARAGLKSTDLTLNDLSALTVDGYTINSRKSVRSCFEELKQAFQFDIIESDGRIKYRTRGANADHVIDHSQLKGNEDGSWLQMRQSNDSARNRKINLTYRDIDREYMENVQSVILAKTGPQLLDSEAAIDVNAPIALSAEKAKRLAEILLYSKEIHKVGYDFALPPSYQSADPADIVHILMPDNTVTKTRLRSVGIGADREVMCEASAEDPDIYNDQVTLFGNVGRFTDKEHKPLTPLVQVVGLPIGGRTGAEFSLTGASYRVYLAFLNYRPNVVLDKPFKLNLLTPGAGITDYLLTPPPGFMTWGFVVNPPLDTRSYFSTDEGSTLRVRLVNATGAAVASSTMANLLQSNSYNLCLVGRELMQFRTAVDEGSGQWLLTGLHRGKFGTEYAIGTQVIGDKFILLGGADGNLDSNGIVPVNFPLEGGPNKVFQIFLDTNNPFQPSEVQLVGAANLRPWMVTSLDMRYVSADVVLTWQRRARFGGEWADDGTDFVPINEASELYTIWLFKDPTTFNLNNSAKYLRKVQAASPTFTYTAAMQAADGFVSATDDLFCLVAQVGVDVGYATGRAVSDL